MACCERGRYSGVATSQNAESFGFVRTSVRERALNIYTGFAIGIAVRSRRADFTLRDLNGQTITTGHGTLAAGAHSSKMCMSEDIGSGLQCPQPSRRDAHGSFRSRAISPCRSGAAMTQTSGFDVLLTVRRLRIYPSRRQLASVFHNWSTWWYTTSVVLLNTSDAR